MTSDQFTDLSKKCRAAIGDAAAAIAKRHGLEMPALYICLANKEADEIVAQGLLSGDDHDVSMGKEMVWHALGKPTEAIHWPDDKSDKPFTLH